MQVLEVSKVIITKNSRKISCSLNPLYENLDWKSTKLMRSYSNIVSPPVRSDPRQPRGPRGRGSRRSARIGRTAVFTPMWWVPTGKNQREPLQVGWYHSVAEDLCRLLTHWVPSWGVQYYVSRSDRLYLFRGNNAQYTLPTTSLWNIGMCVLRNASVKQLNLRRL